ncbi:MAG: hypothetical protein ACO1OX_02955 [Novosphingobium sp.]
MRNRVLVLLAVTAAYAAAFFPLLAMGREGPWLAMLLFVSGLPFLALAIVFGVVFPDPIRAHPWRWSVSASAIAVLTSALALWFLTGSAIGLLSVIPATFAPLAFKLVLKFGDR